MNPETSKALAELARAAIIHTTGKESEGPVTFTMCHRGPRFGRSTCMCCHRKLTDPNSVVRGLGRICAAKIEAENEAESGDKYDLPFDPETMDIICGRDADGTKHFNIFQVFKHHSPTGFEWGFGGSGPADFALNIMAMFLHNHDIDKRTIRLWDGKKVTPTVWRLYQEFKRSVLFGSLDSEGGTIKGKYIRQWIAAELRRQNAQTKTP